MAERTAPWVVDGVPTGSVEARLMTESLLDQMGPVGAGDLAVTWTAGMNLSVAAGRAFIRSSTAFGGAYHVVNDAAKALTVQAADPANPRLDLVVAQVTGSSWQLAVVKGTAAATPAEPATPADSIVLAVVTVGTAVATLSAAVVEDRRIFSEAMRLSTDLGWRNALRNGDMFVNQRGPGAFSTANAYTIDGWLLNYSGAAGPAVTRVAAPVGTGLGQDGAQAYAQVGTTAQSAAGDYVVFSQRIESVRSFAGKVVTLSFLASANAGTPRIGVEVEQNFGTGGAPSATVTTAVKAVRISTTVTRYNVTFTVPSIVGKALGTAGNDYLALNLWLSSGATNAARASSIGIQVASFFLTDIQLEIGPVATPFERLPYAVQLAWCQRYYWRDTATGANYIYSRVMLMAYSTTHAVGLLGYPVPMRAVPTLNTSVGLPAVYNNAGTPVAVTSVNVTGTHANSGVVDVTTTGMAAGQATMLLGGAAQYLEASAEL